MTISFLLRKLRQIILDILFPIECLSCGQADVWLCAECFKKLPLRSGYFEPLDFEPLFLDGFLIGSEWEDKIVQKLIHQYKYNFSQELSQPLAEILAKKLLAIFEIYPEIKNFVLLPVPLHRRRFFWRGFNQAELLARLVAEKFDLPLETNLIKRIKNTSPQVKLKSEARRKNIAGAFKCQPGMTAENVILVDDVITTGATMNELARVLKESGVKKVYGLAVARG